MASRVIGEKRLRRNLSSLERRLAPRAMANSLNRTGTKTRQQVVADARAGGSRLSASELRRLIYVSQRARAPDRLTTGVSRQTPVTRPRASVALSRPFVVRRFGGRQFRRAESFPAGYSGRGWSEGRPRTSSPNLPIVATEAPRSAIRAILHRTLLAAAQNQMRRFLPGEFRIQLAKQVAKLKARGK